MSATRRSTWDSAAASPRLHCNTLVLDVFQGPSDAPGIQRQPVQKHNTPGSIPDTPVRNGSSFKMCLSAWQKQQSPSACAANNGRSSEGLALPIRQLSTRVHTSKGSESRQTPTGLAVPLVPLDRQASHDCQKWLAFTPPASLSSPHSSRRVSQGLPGGAGRLLNQADDSALRLPPLTPPGAEASTCGSLPQPPPMPPASGSASPNLWRSANAPALRPGSYPAGSLPPGTAAAEVDTLTAKLHSQQSLVQQGMASHSAQPVLHAAGSAAIGEQLLPSNHKVSSGHEQVEAKLVAVQLHDHEQQNPAGRPQGTSTSMQQQRRHASSAGGDMGQLGPPITRMRPAPLPAFSNSAGKKSTSKPQAAADSSSSFAEAFLCDAVLCGWEQHTNEGDLYPLTLALEKQGAEGVDLQTLQLAAHLQLAGRSAGPPLPPGSPSRTKTGKTRLLRKWRQE